MPLIEVKGLSKSYEGKPALTELSFNIESGEIVALLGANGSGKTTTIKSICSLLEYEQGEIYYSGENIKNGPGYLRNIGSVLEGSRNVHWRLTAMQNAEYFSTLRGGQWKQCRKIAEELAELIGLGPHMHLEVGKMSSGNRQKVAVLCALTHKPQFIMLDEPTIGLDVDTVAQVKSFIIAQAGSHQQSFLITSHDLPFIDKICHRVIVLNEGVKVFDDSLDNLKRQLHKFELVLKSGSELSTEQCEKLTGSFHEKSAIVEIDPQQFRIRFNDSQTGLQVASEAESAGIQADFLEIKEISMEQAYVELVKGGAKNVEIS